SATITAPRRPPSARPPPTAATCRRWRSSTLPLREGWKSQPQNRLGDDVALDLVRAAVDRGLAHVEIAPRDAPGVVGTGRVFVAAHAALVGERVVAHRFLGQLGDALLDLGAADLQDRAFGAGHVALGFLRQRAQLGEFERRELDLELGDLPR